MPNADWLATAGGTDGSSLTAKSLSLPDKIRQRNSDVGRLTGVVTPGMVHSSHLATDLQSAGQLPGEVTRAGPGGLRMGGKALPRMMPKRHWLYQMRN